jgi:hypothetical protein
MTRSIVLSSVVVLALASLAGCVLRRGPSVDSPPRPAVDAPDAFRVGTLDPTGMLAEPQPGGPCRSPMVDPRDGTRLTLIQSQAAGNGYMGDYAVLDGRYGVGPGELLRLDCGTGRPVGIVASRR